VKHAIRAGALATRSGSVSSACWLRRAHRFGGHNPRVEAPYGGHSTGVSPTDRAKSGTKRSLCRDANGVPLVVMIEGANRNDCKLLEATLNAVDWTPADGPRLAVLRDNGDDHAFCRDPITARGHEPASTAADRKPVRPAAAPARAAGSPKAPSHGSTASADYSSAGNSSAAPASRSSSSQQHSSPGAKPTPSPEPKRPTENALLGGDRRRIRCCRQYQLKYGAGAGC
jgi:hypothetical protein